MIRIAMLVLAGAAPASNWLPLNSPSPAVTRGFDAVFAARDFDNKTQRFTSERIVVPVRLNCRSWSVIIGAGRVQGGDGNMIGMDGQAQPANDGDPDQWKQACGPGRFGKGAATLEAFLDRQWPADAGHGRAW